MDSASAGGPDRRVTPVSADDVARVLNRALSERSRVRIRLTAGQRRSILGRRLRPA